MNIEQNTYKRLHNRTRGKFPTLDDDTQVFIARQGTRIVGTAFVQHKQTTTRPDWSARSFEDRAISCTVNTADTTVAAALIQEARDITKHLKRRFTVNTAN